MIFPASLPATFPSLLCCCAWLYQRLFLSQWNWVIFDSCSRTPWYKIYVHTFYICMYKVFQILDKLRHWYYSINSYKSGITMLPSVTLCGGASFSFTTSQPTSVTPFWTLVYSTTNCSVKKGSTLRSPIWFMWLFGWINLFYLVEITQ